MLTTHYLEELRQSRIGSLHAQGLKIAVEGPRRTPRELSGPIEFDRALPDGVDRKRPPAHHRRDEPPRRSSQGLDRDVERDPGDSSRLGGPVSTRPFGQPRSTQATNSTIVRSPSQGRRRASWRYELLSFSRHPLTLSCRIMIPQQAGRRNGCRTDPLVCGLCHRDSAETPTSAAQRICSCSS